MEMVLPVIEAEGVRGVQPLAAFQHPLDVGEDGGRQDAALIANNRSNLENW